MNNSNYYDNEMINKIRLNINNYLDDDDNSKKFMDYANYIKTGGSCPCDKVLNAFGKSNVDLAVYIIEEGKCCNMCIDKEGNTILHHLVNYAFNEDCHSVLLSVINSKNSSEFINMQNYKGQTPMLLAVANDNEDLALNFKNAGARTDIRDNDGNYIGTNDDELNANATFIKNVINVTLPNKSIDTERTEDFFERLDMPKRDSIPISTYESEQSDQSEQSMQGNNDSSLNTEQFFDLLVKKNNLVQSMKKEESDMKKNSSNGTIFSDNSSNIDLSEMADTPAFIQAIQHKYGNNKNSDVRTQQLFSEDTTPMDITNSEINRLVGEETSDNNQDVIQQQAKPHNFNVFKNGKNNAESDQLTNSSLVNLSSGTIDSSLLKKEIGKLSMLSKFNTLKGGGLKNEVTRSYRYLNSDSDSNLASLNNSEAQYLSDFEYDMNQMGAGNEISRMLNNKKSQLHQEVIDNFIEMLNDGLIKENSKKITGDEKNASLLKFYVYQKVSKENPQMTGMDKILLIKGMSNDDIVKFISKMPTMDQLEKERQGLKDKNMKEKEKNKNNDSDMTNSDSNSEQSDMSSDDSKKKSTTKKTTPKKAATKKTTPKKTATKKTAAKKTKK